MPKHRYTLDKILDFGKHLATLPEKLRKPKTDNLGDADLVRTLHAEIRDAMNRGYSIEDIVSAAKSMGFDLSTPTLKKYIRQSKETIAKPITDIKKKTKKTNAQPSEKPGSGISKVTFPEGDL